MYDVTADGTRFLMVATQTANDLNVPLIVVKNFVAELLAKVRAQ